VILRHCNRPAACKSRSRASENVFQRGVVSGKIGGGIIQRHGALVQKRFRLLPHFRKNQSGLIININSRAGLVGLPLNTLYCASKFALEGFSEALAYELVSQNIIVKLVEPSGGVSRTDFGKRVAAERAQIASLADYDKYIARASAAYSGMAAKRTATADEIARVIYGAATDGTNRRRYFCGEDTGGLVRARRELDDEAFIEFMRSRFSVGNE
jgi:NAD(P)-dependent dehydrogenase (short-subunit alcohol dehydrogenase family)